MKKKLNFMEFMNRCLPNMEDLQDSGQTSGCGSGGCGSQTTANTIVTDGGCSSGGCIDGVVCCVCVCVLLVWWFDWL